MLGGIKTAETAGLKVPNRADIFARIASLSEGRLFRTEDIIGDDHHLSEDFAALRGHDYLHMANGWFVGVVETKYLRRLPRLSTVISSYAALHQCSLVETGDWVAWRAGLKQWEPILGHRFYSDGPDDFLAYTRFGIRILNAPDWLMKDDEISCLLRAFHDIPAKETFEALQRVATNTRIPLANVAKAARYARQIGPLRDEERNRWEWLRCPVEIAELLEDWLKTQQKFREEA